MNRVELCCHSCFDNNGSLIGVKEMMKLAEGYETIGVTDFCSTLVMPRLFIEKDFFRKKNPDKKMKIIFGTEIPVSFANGVYNVSLLAKNNDGKRNIHKFITELGCGAESIEDQAFMNEKNRIGLLAGGNQEIVAAIKDGAGNDILETLAGDYDFLLIDVNDDEIINKKIIEIGDKLNIPVVATCNPCYLNEEDKIIYDVLRCANEREAVYQKGKSEAVEIFMNTESDDNRERIMLSDEQMIEKLAYLSKDEAYKVVVTNSNSIADLCQEISLFGGEKKYPKLPDQDERLRKICYEKAEELYDKNMMDGKVRDRLDWELQAISNNDMAFAFLQDIELLEKMNLKSYEISGRGVWQNSLVAYLCGISDIDPLKYDLSPYFTFGINGNKKIDININIPSDRQEESHELSKTLEGNQTSLIAGTSGDFNRGHINFCMNSYERKNKKKFTEEERELIGERLLHVYHRSGINPGCIISIPYGVDLPEELPIANLNGKKKYEYYDYHYGVDDVFYKQYLLGHDSPMLLNKLAALTGVSLNEISFEDEKVMNLFRPDEKGEFGCKGLPEFRSDFGMDVLKISKPETFEEIVKILGMMHGTDIWLDNIEQLIKDGEINISQAISSRDDIYSYLIEKEIDEELSYAIAEDVRRGIIKRGRKQEFWDSAKEVMSEAGVEEWFISVCEKITYLFPKVHSISYTEMLWREGYFKVYYPEVYEEVMSEYWAEREKTLVD